VALTAEDLELDSMKHQRLSDLYNKDEDIQTFIELKKKEIS